MFANSKKRLRDVPVADAHTVMNLWAGVVPVVPRDEVSDNVILPQPTSSLVPADHFVSKVKKASSSSALRLLSSIPSSSRVVAFDVETTGFHYPRRIMEIGAIEICDDEPTGFLFHKIVNATQSLALERSVSLDGKSDDASKVDGVHPRARAVHAIMPNDETAGGEEAAVLWQFLRFCVGEEAAQRARGGNDWSHVHWPVMVGHNASFDLAIVNEHLTRVLAAPEGALMPPILQPPEIERPVGSHLRATLCTMQLFRQVFPVQATGGSSLDAVAQFFAVRGRDDRALSGHHGALADASLTGKIFCALKAIAADAEDDTELVIADE